MLPTKLVAAAAATGHHTRCKLLLPAAQQRPTARRRRHADAGCMLQHAAAGAVHAGGQLLGGLGAAGAAQAYALSKLELCQALARACVGVMYGNVSVR